MVIVLFLIKLDYETIEYSKGGLLNLNIKKITFTGFAAFTLLTSSALAATGTADKVLNSSSSVTSVSIQGDGGTGYLYTNLYAGTGSGTAKLHRFKRFWPDEKITTRNVASGQGPLYDTYDFVTDAEESYNTVVDGSKTAGIRSSVVIN